MNEQQLGRIESKIDAAGDRLARVETDVAVLKSQFEPMSKFMWLLITGGALAFLTSVASLVLVVKK